MDSAPETEAAEPPGPAAAPAPAAVAIVVTHDAGPWLEEALAAFGAQDYPNLSILVIDAGSAEDPTPRVAEILPAAYIRRLPENPGWSGAANSVLDMVEGAAFLVLCHDDVAPDPNAVRVLVEEALRSNAGVVGPKLVSWDEPDRLLQVGQSIDKTGVAAPLVERGELDQEQHDGVRDVFFVPGAMTLIRADLFAELGGYDALIPLHGDDLDLCWRAQVAGARIVVAPDARVRHLEALPRRRNDEDRRRLQTRHRLRAMLKCYSALTLLRVIPQALLANMGEVLYALVAGRRAHAADVVDAWRWNMRRANGLRAARHQVQSHRRMPDNEVRAQQVRGSARLRAFWRGQLGGEDRAQAMALAGLDMVSSIRRGPRRLSVLVWSAVVLLLLIGSRHLLTERLPAVGQFVPFPEHAFDFLRSAASGWRTNGLGAEGPAPTALSLLGVLGLLLLDGVGLLQKLLVVGALPLGALGAWRLSRPLTPGSRRARLVAVVIYLSIPLSYNALARGRWDALVAYAAAPWVLMRLARATRIPPFDDDARSLARHAVGLGLIVAGCAALVPATAALWLFVAVALALASLVAGSIARSLQAVAVALGAGLIAALLCFPWTLEFVLPGSDVTSFLGVERFAARGPSLGALLRFQTGPLGAPPLGWAFIVAAALPLLIGREWRLTWAIRCWVVALACFGVAWAAGRGWIGTGLPAPDVLLAPAAIALALSVAIGLVAFETDLPGYRFGWRQVAWVGAVAVVVAGTLPVLGAAADGRWNLPDGDHGRSLAWMRDERARGDFRVLWVGDPDVLPATPWQLDDGLGYVMSRNGAPEAVDLWPGSPSAATELVPDYVSVAASGGTTRLGHLLAPMAVRYVVLVEERAPDRFGGQRRSVPSVLREALGAQIDLRRLQSDRALVLYENAAWAPARAALSEAAAEASTIAGPDGALQAELAGSRAVLTKRNGVASWSGPVPSGQVLLSEAASSHWQLKVDGVESLRDRAFGWANSFTVDPAGPGKLQFQTSLLHRLLLLVNLAVWILVLRSAAVNRRRALPDVDEAQL